MALVKKIVWFTNGNVHNHMWNVKCTNELYTNIFL